MRRYRIVHTTSLAYDNTVMASHNEVRMSPLTEVGQTTLDNRIRVRPMTWSHVYRDYWGTMVTAIECVHPHNSLHIESVSTVETQQLINSGDSAGWTGLNDPLLVDRNFEWLYQTERTMPGTGVEAMAESVRSLASPRAAAYRVCELVHEHMTYESGVTEVHSTGEQAWSDRRGVCQDFAHISVGAIRSLGIPARYVSGYLTPSRNMEIGESQVGESHAWVEFWDGAWLPADPTNLREVGQDHIIVARGRDYEDVPPFKGVYSGPGVSQQSVSVELSRLA